MRAVLRVLQLLLGWVIGLAPVVLVTLSSRDSPPTLSDARIVMAVVPGVAALYAWDRYPYLAGGIASAVAIAGGPLNPLFVAYGGFLRAAW